MSEDVSATMRVGITVILVAALVATVLNLMVMSNSLLTGGQTTLQSGIDAVGQQEFAAYNNTKVSGTQVNTALNLFQGRDVAILIQTKSFKQLVHVDDAPEAGSGIFMNYGALISTSMTKSERTDTVCELIGGVSAADATEAKNGHIALIAIDAKSASITDGQRNAQTIHGADKNQLYCTKATINESTYSAPVVREDGQPYYTALLYDTNGIVQTNANVIGTATLGNPQYLLSSARFQSTLIKDNTGSIIGILFYQIN